MSLPKTVDIELTRGDDEPFIATLLDESGAPLNLTGCALRFTLKDAFDRREDNSGALAALSWITGTASGIAVADPYAGIARIELPHTAMALLTPGETYVYDLELTAADGRKTTVAAGNVTVAADVTR